MTPGEQTREFYREQGRVEEQARIIKILTAKTTCVGNEHNYNGYCYCEEIALIKGEQQ